MLKNRRSIRTALMAGGCALVAALVMGAGAGARLISPHGVVESHSASQAQAAPQRNPRETEVVVLPVLGDRIIPRVRIIQWDDTVARFDTATGEIHIMRGDLRNPNVRNQWILHVRGVERTSGVLDFQQPIGVQAIDAPFLVDMVTGDTWILRRRGDRATWDRVDIFR
jgi:hypothetical protein